MNNRLQILLALCTLALLIGAVAGLSSLYADGGAPAKRAVAVARAADVADRPAGSSGCDPARAHDAGDFDRTVLSEGVTRDYILHLPPSYAGDESTPVVLNFHGLGSNASEQADYSDLPEKADDEGFILVTPNGSSTAFLPTRHWNFLTGIPESPDDVAFVGDLLDELTSQLCIDESRVFSTGISNGAMMSVRLACDLSDRIAAIAPVAGVYYPPWSPDLAIEPACESSRPVPVVAFHGTADTVVPFQGGALGIFGLEFDLSHIEDEVLPAWAAHNGCSTFSNAGQVAEHVSWVRYELCPADADTELYIIEGGGHLWPGASDIPGVDVNDEISATDLMWEFFEDHSLAYLPGDANCDGTLNSIDASLVLQRSAGLIASFSCPSDADVNHDGQIDARDAALILQHTAGLLPELPS